MEGIRGAIRGRDLLPHRGGGPGGRGLVWFLFEFYGLCAERFVEADHDTVGGLCSAFELLAVEADHDGAGGDGCAVGLCVRQGSALWGKDFPGLGLDGVALAAAWGPASSSSSSSDGAAVGVEGALYFLAASFSGENEARLGCYAILFYEALAPYTGRAADAVRWWGLTYYYYWDPMMPSSSSSRPAFVFGTNVGGMGVAADGALFVGLCPPSSSHSPPSGPLLWRLLCAGGACVAAPVPDSGVELAGGGTLLSGLLAAGGGVVQVGPAIGEALLSFQTADGALHVLDLLNRILAPGLRRAPRGSDDVGGGGGGGNRWGLSWASYPAVTLAALDGDARLLLLQPGARACPLDTVARYVEEPDPYVASAVGWPPPLPDLRMQECAPLACIRARPCGGNSRRQFGKAACECDPGYAAVVSTLTPNATATTTCIECGEAVVVVGGAASFFCPGGTVPPQRCQPHSAVSAAALTAPASSRGDCLCEAGHFLFQDTCIRCPLSLWCPFNGTVAPIACHGGGLTYNDGARSPIDCVCPPRTHGLRCAPCDNAMECTRFMPAAVTSVAIRGWGPVGGGAIMDACFAWALGDADLFQMYSVLGASRSAEVEAAARQQQSASLLEWSWIVLVRDFNTDNALAAVEECAWGQFVGLRLEALTTPPVLRSIRKASSCGGRHWEWNGDRAAEGCVCVGGYEEIDTVLYGRHCIPCPNGTFRPRYDPGGCTRCRSELYEAGAYLGQSECACRQGYARDPRTWSCQPVVLVGATDDEAPRRIAPLLAAHLHAVMLACIGASAAAFMFSLVLVCAL